MKFRQFFYFALTVLFCQVLVAQTFTVQTSAGLEIKHKSLPLIVKEALNLTLQKPTQQSIDLLQFGQEDNALFAEETRVHNIYGKAQEITFRRELTSYNNGREVELAFMADVPSYFEHLIDSEVNYEVTFPIEQFLGSPFKVYYGRASKLLEAEGVIKASAGVIGSATIRQIALTKNDGTELVIDCNPKGIGSRGDYPPNRVVGLWTVRSTKDSLVFSRVFRPNFYGGMSAAHLRIYEGNHEDFFTRHANAEYRYFSELIPDRQYVFGAMEFGANYTDAGVNSFSDEKQFGWLENKNLKVSTFRPRGAFYSSVKSQQDAAFKMKSLRSGLHIITIVTGTGEEKVGPFSIRCNDKLIKDNIIVAEKSAHTLSFPVWLEDETTIAFSGDWAVSTISDQLLLTNYEDYTFKRGFWFNNEIPEPSVLYSKYAYPKEPEYTVNSSVFPLPEPGQEAAAELKELRYPEAHAVFKDGEDWRGKANIGSMGPGNNGSFLEFDSQDKIDRRIAELKEDNFNAILINGFLSRHTFPTHLDRVEKNIAAMVATGHKEGIKFIDHQDHSLLWDAESGFRVLTENMPYLQQTFDGQLSARGFCPSNPKYMKKFLNYIVNHIKNTNIDGVMIDEVSFHGLKFCACAECRKLFTAETGWYLPADECSEELLNKESKLWRAWLRWRQKRIGDFWYNLKSEVHSFKADFVVMGYSTHYGMTSTYASLTQGGALEQRARGYDFIGTEIMTRNIFASYRAVMSLRRAKAQFQFANGLPVFGLVYTAAFDWDLMYFGWALNNLLGQRTWEMTGKYCPEDKVNYRLFTADKGNIDFTTAQQVSKVALLYSNQSRDWPRGASYPPDVLGISQLLGLQQTPHVFINETGLKKEILDRYNVLIVSNAMALSDKNIKAIKDFAADGGTVYLSNRVASSNENGDPREDWPFEEEFKLKRAARTRTVAKIFVGENLQEIFEPESDVYALRLIPAKDNDLKVLLEYEDKAGNRYPGAFEVSYGKGKMIYCSILLGAPARDSEVGVGKKVSFERSEQTEKAALTLLAEFIKDQEKAWKPLNVPEDILTNLHIDKDELTIHFLNATGSKTKTGDTIPVHAPKVAFPAIKEDLSFIVNVPTLTKAYAVSPDFNGEINLKTEKVAENEYKITLPADKLITYTLVRIR